MESLGASRGSERGRVRRRLVAIHVGGNRRQLGSNAGHRVGTKRQAQRRGLGLDRSDDRARGLLWVARLFAGLLRVLEAWCPPFPGFFSTTRAAGISPPSFRPSSTS